MESVVRMIGTRFASGRQTVADMIQVELSAPVNIRGGPATPSGVELSPWCRRGCVSAGCLARVSPGGPHGAAQSL